MSNFSALTRRKGSNDEFRDAVWIDGYFSNGGYGVRFRGTVTVLDGNEYEIKQPSKEWKVFLGVED